MFAYRHSQLRTSWECKMFAKRARVSLAQMRSQEESSRSGTEVRGRACTEAMREEAGARGGAYMCAGVGGLMACWSGG
ncbi:hypothetical protein GOBAR_DD07563 [Gossypium barbadense]|nr:hypothetical protein GOBAR_DD07563 [Gossypium barbadense]